MRLRALIVVWLLAASASFAQTNTSFRVALTFDDLPATGQAPKSESRIAIVQSILDTLHREKLPPTYGFVNGIRSTDAADTTTKVLTAWRASGNLLGNHTWSHSDLETESVEDFEADIAKNESILQQYAGTTDWHFFRYPFLHEGETTAKHQQIKQYLAAHGYRIAEVSIDFEDPMFNAPYARCVDQGKTGSVEALHDSYLAIADEYTDLFRSMSQRLYGRDIPYIMLLHVGVATSHMLPELIAQLRSRGATFITLQEALNDPAYREAPAIGLPTGGALQEMGYTAKHIVFPPSVKPYEYLDHFCSEPKPAK